MKKYACLLFSCQSVRSSWVDGKNQGYREVVGIESRKAFRMGFYAPRRSTIHLFQIKWPTRTGSAFQICGALGDEGFQNCRAQSES